MDDTTRDKIRDVAQRYDAARSALAAVRRERESLLRELHESHALNVSEAARDMGISRRSVHEIIK